MAIYHIYLHYSLFIRWIKKKIKSLGFRGTSISTVCLLMYVCCLILEIDWGVPPEFPRLCRVKVLLIGYSPAIMFLLIKISNLIRFPNYSYCQVGNWIISNFFDDNKKLIRKILNLEIVKKNTEFWS